MNIFYIFLIIFFASISSQKLLSESVFDSNFIDINIESLNANETKMSSINDVKNIPDLVPLIQTDYITEEITFNKPTQKTIDSLYASSNLIRFFRTDCKDTVRVDIPRNFGYLLDTLFSSSTIVSESVIDTIYTLKEPVNDDFEDLQTSYVKNKYLLKFIPIN